MNPQPRCTLALQLVFADGKPSVWYFSSGKDKAIKRKHRGNINNVNVNEAFVPKLLAAALANGDGGHCSDHLGANATTGGLGMGAGTGWVSSLEPPAQKLHLNRTDPGPGTVAGPRAVEPGTSTGVTLGPWPNPGVVARFQGTMTMPHGAASSPKRKKGGVRRGRGTAVCGSVTTAALNQPALWQWPACVRLPVAYCKHRVGCKQLTVTGTHVAADPAALSLSPTQSPPYLCPPGPGRAAGAAGVPRGVHHARRPGGAAAARPPGGARRGGAARGRAAALRAAQGAPPRSRTRNVVAKREAGRVGGYTLNGEGGKVG